MGKSTDSDMTQGVIWKQLLRFFFPLMAGSFFQMLYNMVDTVIVGRYVGTVALSAVGGATAILIEVFISFFMGIASGSTVIVAQTYGAGRKDEISRAVHTSMMLAVILGIALTAIGVIFAPAMLKAMRAPADTLADSITYLRIYCGGMFVSMLYNMGAGILRAIGDSRRPFYYLVAGTMTNVALDIVLVAVLRLGVAGAALATVISQAVSAVLMLISMMRTKDFYRLSLRKLRIDGFYLKKILHIGIPATFQSMMYSFSNVMIQSYVNAFGTVIVAGWAITSKIDFIYWMISNSLGIAITTFVGQNYGAGKMKRVYKCMRESLVIAALFTVSFAAIAYTFTPQILAMFTKDLDVIAIGIQIERFFAPSYLTYFVIEVLAGVLRGKGDAVFPTIMSVFGICLLRIGWLLVMVPRSYNIWTVSWSYPVTWAVTSVAYIIYFVWRYRGEAKAAKAAPVRERQAA